MNTLVFCGFKRLSSTFNIALGRTGQRTDGRAFDLFGDFIDRFEVAIRCDGKACLDDVDLQFRQSMGDPQLFINRH